MPTIILAMLLAAAGLVDAVKSGDRTTALSLLQQKVNVNAPEADGTTALHWAVQKDDADLVDRLIKAGANVNAKNDYGSTPMSEAAINGDVAIMDKLLKAGASAESSNADGQTALMIVARTNNVEAARLLLNHGANVNAAEKFHEQTPLMWAAAEGQASMTKELIAHGADVNARSHVNDWDRQVTAEARAIARPAGGLTALLYAARQGCTGCAKALAEGGADLNLADPEGVSPLLLSILNMNFDVAAYLIQKGANVDKWDWWGQSPVYAAVDVNTIPHGGRPDRPSADETTSLQVLQMLLDKGANANLQLKLLPPYRNLGADRGVDGMLTIGTTPLLRAAKGLDAPAIKLLLEHGANPNLPNTRNFIPIVAAAGIGSSDADTRGWFKTDDVQQRAIASLDLLLKAGGDINAKDTQGKTLLLGAAFWGWSDVVKYLAAHGADLSAKDNRGHDAVDTALGKAGGNSRGGQRVDVHQDTADLLKQLIAAKQ
ncbi:MAG TPA: ankyrin repeat domain-containing protein [Terriglobia bacterium]|jgi:ankyrin